MKFTIDINLQNLIIVQMKEERKKEMLKSDVNILIQFFQK